MHSCPAPGNALDGWLESDSSTNGHYGHLLLEQKACIDDGLVAAFRPYFESAHLDAREYFHAQIGIDLHPDADAPGAPLIPHAFRIQLVAAYSARLWPEC